MRSSRAEDNVTTNEQMMELLSVVWKNLPQQVGQDWPEVKKRLLADLAKMEGMDDPADDHLLNVLVDHFHPYPEAMTLIGDACQCIMGEHLPEFDVAMPEASVESDVEFEEESAAVEFEVELEEHESAELIEEEPDYYLVPVHFATNRKRDKRYKLQRSFTGRRSNQLTYGLAHVSMPKTHVAGELETPSRFWREKADPKKHVLVMSLDVLEKGGFVSSANQSLANAKQNEALIYIHGYNVSFGGALRLTAQIATDIGFKGIPITYSWPSYTRTLRYLGDEANIKHGQPFFDDFLEMVVNELNVTKIHILAHSMGNRLLSQGMQTADDRKIAGKLGQVIFASPDVDKDVFSQRARKFAGKAERYTLYINESDLALELSQFLHGFARAGERDNDPLVVDPVDTVDATAVDGSFLGHNFYQNNRTVLGDMMKLVFGNLAPSKRENLRQAPGPKTYWEIINQD